jgi:hypothetical protein
LEIIHESIYEAKQRSLGFDRQNALIKREAQAGTTIMKQTENL